MREARERTSSNFEPKKKGKTKQRSQKQKVCSAAGDIERREREREAGTRRIDRWDIGGDEGEITYDHGGQGHLSRHQSKSIQSGLGRPIAFIPFGHSLL